MDQQWLDPGAGAAVEGNAQALLDHLGGRRRTAAATSSTSGPSRALLRTLSPGTDHAQSTTGIVEQSRSGSRQRQEGVTLDYPPNLERLYELFLKLIPGSLKAPSGVFAFLAESHRRHLKVALASSAAAVKEEYNLREVGPVPSGFDAVVDAIDVERKKPHRASSSRRPSGWSYNQSPASPRKIP